MLAGHEEPARPSLASSGRFPTLSTRARQPSRRRQRRRRICKMPSQRHLPPMRQLKDDICWRHISASATRWPRTSGATPCYDYFTPGADAPPRRDAAHEIICRVARRGARPQPRASGMGQSLCPAWLAAGTPIVVSASRFRRASRLLDAFEFERRRAKPSLAMAARWSMRVNATCSDTKAAPTTKRQTATRSL